jgi:hypothetical protein
MTRTLLPLALLLLAADGGAFDGPIFYFTPAE